MHALPASDYPFVGLSKTASAVCRTENPYLMSAQMVATIATAPLNHTHSVNTTHTLFTLNYVLHSYQGTCAASTSQTKLLHMKEHSLALPVVAGARPREWPTKTIRCLSAAALSYALTNGPGSDPVLPAAAITASLSTKPCRQFKHRFSHDADAGVCTCAHAHSLGSVYHM